MKVLKILLVLVSVLLTVSLLKVALEYHERPVLEVISH